MKTLIGKITILFVAIFMASCFDDPGTEIVWGDKAYLELDRAGQAGSAPSVPLTVTRVNDGNAVPLNVKVNLMGRPQSEDVSVTFEIDATSTAVAGVHYNKLTAGNTITIPAGENVANIEFEILDENINPGELWKLKINVTGGDLPLSNYVSATWNIQVACPSDLGGTYSYSMTNILYGAGASVCSSPQTGNGTLTEGANGEYTSTDFTFGQFACAYGDTPPAGTLKLKDLCDKLSFTGQDKYGDTYTINVISVTATVLTFDWVNTYGDGGRVALTRTDAKTWPLTLTD
jgi:hypothetical protein